MIVSPVLFRAVRELGQWSLRQRARVRVVGPSMEPTLSEGDFVLVDLLPVDADAGPDEPTATATVGELVVASHPETDLLVVKRLAEHLDDGRVVLSSDNPAGTDSRTWGPLPADAIKGRVTLILSRPFASTQARSTQTRSRDSVDRGDVLRWLRR